MVTVTDVAVPPTSDVAITLTVLTVGAATVRKALTVVWATVAPMLALTFAAILVVVIVNAGEVVAPAAMVTLAGTVASALLELSVTTVLAGALPDKVTVPVTEPPPRMLDSESVTSSGTGGSSAIKADLTPPPPLAVMVALILLATGCAVTAKVPVVPPCAIVIEAGTLTVGLLFDESVTTKPPLAAAGLIVTVPVIAAPP